MNLKPEYSGVREWVRTAVPIAASILVAVIGFFMVRTLDSIDEKLDSLDALTRQVIVQQSSQESVVREHDRRLEELSRRVLEIERETYRRD